MGAVFVLLFAVIFGVPTIISRMDESVSRTNRMRSIRRVSSTKPGACTDLSNIPNSVNRQDHYDVIVNCCSESTPKFTTNTTSQYIAIEGDYIKYSCEVTYAGKWAPVMIWRIGGKNVTEVKNESTRNTVKFSIVVEITRSINELQISCETKFDQPKHGTSPNKAANNVPRYSYRYRIPALTICYVPKNITITPEFKAYKPGTTIQVTADSFPPLSSYKWVDTTTNTPIGTENSITITANMVGRASLKVVLCNTMPIPPVYDVCCEVTLSFEVRFDVNKAANAGSPITKTTCGTRGTRPTRGTSPSTTTTTQRTTPVSPSFSYGRILVPYGVPAPPPDPLVSNTDNYTTTGPRGCLATNTPIVPNWRHLVNVI